VARYSPPPAGYRPWLKLQLRDSVEGGDLLAAVRQIPPLDPAARRVAVLLVHGFNNHEGEAGAAYDGLRARQYARAPTLVPPGLERILADVFWPGDAAWGLFDLVDFLVYPAAVAAARDAAPLLAGHLRSMPSLVAVHFVGHSLGCRVVLETIDDLARNGGPHVGKVCLMAAAVPVFKVRQPGALARAMEHAADVRILHSDDDAVLRYTFAPGQTLASGDEGFFPTALGLHGPPPGVPGRLDPIRVGGAGHGDYWGHSQRPPAARAADRIAEFFQFGSWARRVGEPSPGAASREASADRREIGRARVL
jgi:hypothetical protein